MDLTMEQQGLVAAWHRASGELAKAKKAEMELRVQVAVAIFPNAVIGTNNVDLPGGWLIKLVRKHNFSLKNTVDGSETEKALDAIEAMGNEGPFIADRLVKWSPELSITEYKKLSKDSPGHVKIKELIDSVLTVSDAAPALELVAPKA